MIYDKWVLGLKIFQIYETYIIMWHCRTSEMLENEILNNWVDFTSSLPDERASDDFDMKPDRQSILQKRSTTTLKKN